MKAIVINEDNHGFIGLAANYPWAIDFLIKEDWLNSACDFWDEKNSKWVSVQNYFGDNWQAVLKGLTLEEFNRLWEGCFMLVEEEVHGVNYWG